jgi:hypothetical protein
LWSWRPRSSDARSLRFRRTRCADARSRLARWAPHGSLPDRALFRMWGASAAKCRRYSGYKRRSGADPRGDPRGDQGTEPQRSCGLSCRVPRFPRHLAAGVRELTA